MDARRRRRMVTRLLRCGRPLACIATIMTGAFFPGAEVACFDHISDARREDVVLFSSLLQSGPWHDTAGFLHGLTRVTD